MEKARIEKIYIINIQTQTNYMVQRKRKRMCTEKYL